MSKFTGYLMKWYDENKRSLPWRGYGSPYAVWVSEIMLQQTRVEAVIPYFQRWMERFPDIAALANASEREVLHQWEGLGYYARARNLRRAAQIVERQHDGQLPSDVEVLRALPGIGRYTAGAIASIAFGLDEAALDGNIRRVLARVFDVSEPARSPAGEKILWQLASKHLPKGRAGDYNQAIMDLGATICVPARPRCPICPVRAVCLARKLGIQEQRPVLLTNKISPHYVYVAVVIVRRGRVLLAQRPSNGLLGGMWEFPNGRVERVPAKNIAKTIRKLYDVEVQPDEPLCVVRHGYSHFTVEVHAFRCSAADVPKRRNLQWALISALGDFPMGRIDRQIAGKLRDG
jgi:A/G-specific adenine glycosylase